MSETSDAFRISLGVQIDTKNITDQIQGMKPPKITLDIDVKDLKTKIQSAVTDGLVSIMKAFDIGNNNPNDVLDGIMSKVNVIGNTAATSNAEIVNMLSEYFANILTKELDDAREQKRACTIDIYAW